MNWPVESREGATNWEREHSPPRPSHHLNVTRLNGLFTTHDRAHSLIMVGIIHQRFHFGHNMHYFRDISQNRSQWSKLDLSDLAKMMFILGSLHILSQYWYHPANLHDTKNGQYSGTTEQFLIKWLEVMKIDKLCPFRPCKRTFRGLCEAPLQINF